jgi:hypothetical protein
MADNAVDLQCHETMPGPLEMKSPSPEPPHGSPRKRARVWVAPSSDEESGEED